MVLKPPDLKTCEELEKAGFPQELEYLQKYYTPKGHIFIYGTPNSIAYRKTPEDNDRNKCITIPTLEPLLDWFVKDFAERWAEKHRARVWNISIEHSSYEYPRAKKGHWLIEMLFEDVHIGDAGYHARYEDREFVATNPDPLTAVLELFKQMDEEMSDAR